MMSLLSGQYCTELMGRNPPIVFMCSQMTMVCIKWKLMVTAPGISITQGCTVSLHDIDGIIIYYSVLHSKVLIALWLYTLLQRSDISDPLTTVTE